MTGAPAAIRLRRLDLRTPAAEAAARPDLAAMTRRRAVPDPAVRAQVRDMLDAIRPDPSAGVRDAGGRFGGSPADGRLVLTMGDLQQARDALTPDVRAAIQHAAANVERFAVSQRPPTTRTTVQDGIDIERRWEPLDSVGCYVPGGSAAYPSSLVMTVVPARVAGIERIVVATPAGADGAPDTIVLGAAGLLGVDAVVVAGGSQAIAALAFGLPDDGLAPVDAIVGPGNAWVTAAKLELAGEVGIDLPAGPSEGMVLADATADPAIVAADLITQAEHGPDSPAILVTTHTSLADRVEDEVARRLATAPRRAILGRSLGAHGAIVLARDLDQAIDVVNRYAPEHLSVDVEPLEATVARLRHAGSIFVGRWAPESAGDYATGANHVLPTGGLARACGPLAVETFGHFVQVQRLTREGLATIRGTIGTLAAAEGLPAHRDAVEVRFR